MSDRRANSAFQSFWAAFFGGKTLHQSGINADNGGPNVNDRCETGTHRDDHSRMAKPEPPRGMPTHSWSWSSQYSAPDGVRWLSGRFCQSLKMGIEGSTSGSLLGSRSIFLPEYLAARPGPFPRREPL